MLAISPHERGGRVDGCSTWIFWGCASQERGRQSDRERRASVRMRGHASRTGLAWEVWIWNTIKPHVLITRMIRSAGRMIGAYIGKEIWERKSKMNSVTKETRTFTFVGRWGSILI